MKKKNIQNSGPQIRWSLFVCVSLLIMDPSLSLNHQEIPTHSVCAIFILLYNNNPEIAKLEVIALSHQSRSIKVNLLPLTGLKCLKLNSPTSDWHHPCSNLLKPAAPGIGLHTHTHTHMQTLSHGNQACQPPQAKPNHPNQPPDPPSHPKPDL